MIGRRKPPGEERSERERAAAAAERMRRRGLDPATVAGQFNLDREDGLDEPPPPPPPSRHAHEAQEDEAPRGALWTQPEPEPEYEPEAREPEPPSYEPEPESAYEAEPLATPEVPSAPQPAPEPEPMPEPPTAPQPAPEPEPLPEPPATPQPAPEPEPDPVPPPAARRGRRVAPPRPGGPRKRQAPPLAARGSRPKRPPRAPRRRIPPPGPQPHRAGRRIVGVGVLALVLLAAWLVVKTFQPFHDDPSGSVAVTVPEGADAGDIGTLLAEQGIVDSGTFFSLNATLTGRRGGLRPGDYTLREGMSYGAALDALTAGPPPKKAAPTFKLTLPEGLSRRELVEPVKDAGVRGSYLKASASKKALRQARELGLPSASETTEGYLFPATYDLAKGATASDLVARQLEAFDANTSQVDYAYAKKRNLTRYEVLIIASMVERETQLDRERPLVAAVIYNRLRDGMPLGIDATIRYAEENWTRPLRVSELERPGPYNSRLNRGLPPTPIGNPGVASLEAAARPADVDYLYYVVKPGTNGHAFSSTDAQFQRDLERYNAAREANGGNSPTP